MRRRQTKDFNGKNAAIPGVGSGMGREAHRIVSIQQHVNWIAECIKSMGESAHHTIETNVAHANAGEGRIKRNLKHG